MNWPAYDTLLIDIVDTQVALIRMNRPDSANALNTQMAKELVDFLEAVAMDAGSLRCLVLTGVGERAFCAGGDLKERNGMTDDTWRAQHLVFERMARALLGCPIPLIAAVNGAAFGGGCEIAAACDFIYAARGAKFALTETRLGIIPGAGGTQTLSRALGERRAKELIMSAATFDAESAAAWGLVNQIIPGDRLIAESLAVAKRIASNAILAVRQAKQAIHRGLQMPLSDALVVEIEAYNRLVPTEDRREGVLSFNERRSPNFVGR